MIVKKIYASLAFCFFLTLVCSELAHSQSQQQPTAESYFLAGKKAHESGKLEDAILAYSAAIDIERTYAPALYNRGAAYFTLSKFAKSLEDFSAFIRINPDDIDAIERRGNVYYMMGDFMKAVEDYTILLNVKTSPEILVNRAIALKENGQYARANEDFDYAIRLDESLIPAWNGRGECSFLQKKYADAVYAYQKTVHIAPTNFRGRYGLGLAQLKTGNYEAALQNLETAASIQSDPTTLAALAYAYFKLNNLEKADIFANEAHNKDVRCADAYNVLGLVALQRNTLDVAERLFEEAITWMPNHSDGLYNLGYTRFLQHNYEAARADLDKAIAQNPKNGDAYYARASVRIMLNDPTGACNDYRYAQQLSYTPFAEDDASGFCN